VAIIDWWSRYVLTWPLSNTPDVAFCLEALEMALVQGCPEIFNADQGVQFTSLAFTLERAGAHSAWMAWAARWIIIFITVWLSVANRASGACSGPGLITRCRS
jgi:hypothetical protein